MHRKKLIEVALPLDAINAASAREKSIRHGHPSTLHLWWARRPLAAARAVIFAQMVDDPSEWPELFPTEAEQDAERERLFKLIEELVKWENTTNEDVLEDARRKIWDNWRRTCEAHADDPSATELFDPAHPPAFHDPFAGGGALPLEAQRLGLEAHAGDLNPVAVLINKAMIEIPPKFAGRPPVNPEWRSKPDEEKALSTWSGAQGLAEDVRYYGKWMRDEAQKRIGHLYPKASISTETCRGRPDLKKYKGRELTVIAWLWARTVRSLNPAFADVEVPLVSSFWLSRKKGKEAWVRPVVEGRKWRFEVREGVPGDPEGVGRGTKSGGSGSVFLCLLSGTPVPFEHIRSEAKLGRTGSRLMAVVAEGDRERVYLDPTMEHEELARQAIPAKLPETELPPKALGFRIQQYGMTRWRDLFTRRQLAALAAFSDLVTEARDQAEHDAVAAGMPNDGKALRNGGRGAVAYAEAVGTYISFAVDKNANYGSTLCAWHQTRSGIVSTFGRQALPMVWDYAEANPLSTSSGNFLSGIVQASKVVECLPTAKQGIVCQEDAQQQRTSAGKVVSTDPPYYDNIGYADLSDFFYVWLRRSLSMQFPDLFLSITVPKAEELVATPFRHGGKTEAEHFFLAGMVQAMRRLVLECHPACPVTIYYAFKQSESRGTDGGASTGWETFLQAVADVGFAITGTRWAVAWFESHGFEAGEFGVAEVLAKAKNISINGLAEAGVLESMGGQVRLLRPSELSEDWDPGENGQPTTWEKTHHLLKVYAESGEIGAAKLLDRLGPTDDAARDLAYSAYLICERKKWASVAFGYNALVQSWPEIVRQARLKPWLAESAQFELGEDSDAD